jgi:hypothetical protein
MHAGLLALAATITVTPADDYKKIEAAQAGDEVVIAPGTYKFLVYLTQKGPITIRAQDPKSPPVWDLSGTLLDSAPGSYTAGDRNRGCWQISGSNDITIESIVFTNCHNSSQNAAGIRYYNGATGLVVRDCVFLTNDNGLTGGSQASEATVEFSEFAANGNTAATSPTHNIYIYGGTFTMRYSYLHDPMQAQNFHVRAAQALLENNWIAHGQSYEGDLMTDDDYTGAGPYGQSMIFRGNVIVEGNPQNHGQIIAVYNDTGVANLTMTVDVVNNTVVAAAPQGALVHLSNADHTKMFATIDNNILTVSTTPFFVDDPANGTVSGKNNWFMTGSNPAPLTGSILGTDPMFKAAYRLATGSAAIGAAAPSVMNPPTREYYYDDKMTRMYRPRLTVKDLGAFESTTTGPGIGPYTDAGTNPDAGSGGPDAGAGGDSGPLADGGAGRGSGGGGCGCDVVGNSGSAGGAALLALVLACRRRARRAS